MKTNYKKVTMTFKSYQVLDDVLSYARYVRTDFKIGTDEKTLILKNISPWFTHKLIAYVNDNFPSAFMNCFMYKGNISKKEIESFKTNKTFKDKKI